MMEISLILDCILRRWMDYGTAEWCILLLRKYGMFTCLLRLLFIILKQEEKREFGDYWRGRAFNTVVSILYPLLPTQIHFLFILLMEKRRQATKFSLLSLSTLPWKMANDDLFSNGENAPFSIKYQKTSLNISSCPLFSPWKIKLSLLPCLVRFEKVKGDLQRWQLRNRTTKKSKTWQTYLVKHDFSPTAQLIFIVHSKSWEFFVGMFFYFSCFYFGCNSHNYEIWMCFSFHKHFFFAVAIHRMPRTMILKIYVEYPLGLLLYDTQCTR